MFNKVVKKVVHLLNAEGKEEEGKEEGLEAKKERVRGLVTKGERVEASLVEEVATNKREQARKGKKG